MSENTPVPPPPNILHMIDWRLTQMHQSLLLHSARIQNNMEERFHSLENNIGRFFSEFNKLKERMVTNTEDIEELKEDNKSILDRLEQMERKLESTEQNSKACNIRIMNVEENEWENEHITTQIIVDVLNDHARSPCWRQEDITRAFRIGRPRPRRSDPRPILVQFCRWTDKMAVLGDRDLRDSLRESGIRVAADLTSRQRDMIEFHRGLGKIAYIHNGRLHVRNRQQDASYRDNSNEWNYPADPRESEEDWPQVPVNRRNEHGNREGSYFSKHSSGRSFRHWYQSDRGNTDHTPEDTTSQSESRRYKSISTSQNHQHRTLQGSPQNREGASHHPERRPHLTWKDSPRSWKRSHLQDPDSDTSIPVVPGIRSYSEVVKHQGPSRENKTPGHKRLVMVKVNNRGPNTSSPATEKATKENPPHTSSQQKTDPPPVENHPTDTNQRQQDRSLIQATEDDGHDIFESQTADGENSTCHGVCGIRTDQQDRIRNETVMTDDDMTTDTDHTQDIEMASANTDVTAETVIQNNEHRGTVKTDDATQNTEQIEEDMSTDAKDEADIQVMDGQKQNKTVDTVPEEQDSGHVTDRVEKEVVKDKKIRSSTRDLRPRRANSSSGVGSQKISKTLNRSSSQNSIMDSFKRVQSNDRTKDKDRLSQVKSKSKDGSSASGTNR